MSGPSSCSDGVRVIVVSTGNYQTSQHHEIESVNSIASKATLSRQSLAQPGRGRGQASTRQQPPRDRLHRVRKPSQVASGVKPTRSKPNRCCGALLAGASTLWPEPLVITSRGYRRDRVPGLAWWSIPALLGDVSGSPRAATRCCHGLGPIYQRHRNQDDQCRGAAGYRAGCTRRSG